MTKRLPSFRHLPPTAVPVRAADLRAGLRGSNSNLVQFQSALASYLGINKAACHLASSGRTALYCLLRGLKSDNAPRNQVVMPAYTCPAVARVAFDLDLQPVFVDISTVTLDYKQNQLLKAVTDKTLAIVQVHPFGIPLAVDNCISVAHDAGAVVIEDAAQAFGAKWDGKPVGTKGDFGLFSLGPGKPISTGGGGIATANHSDYVDAINRWWADLPHASGLISAAAWLRQAVFQLGFHPSGWWAATRVGIHRVGNHESSWGYDLHRLSPSQAGVGLSLLPRLDDINAQRRHNASYLQDIIGLQDQVHSFSVPEKADPIYLRFPLLVNGKEQRELLFDRFWSAGIGAGRLYEKSLPTIFTMNDPALFPGAEAVASRLLTLPTHHYVSDNAIQIMSDILLQPM